MTGFLVGTLSEINEQVSQQTFGQWDSLSLLGVLESRAGKPVFLVMVGKNNIIVA